MVYDNNNNQQQSPSTTPPQSSIDESITNIPEKLTHNEPNNDSMIYNNDSNINVKERQISDITYNSSNNSMNNDKMYTIDIDNNDKTLHEHDNSDNTQQHDNTNEQQPPDTTFKRLPCQLDICQNTISLWYKVALWTWLSHIFQTAQHKHITDSDLPELSHNDDTNELLQRFEQNYINMCKQSPNNEVATWRVLMKTFWKQWLVPVLILIPYSGARIAQPLFLKQIVLNIASVTTLNPLAAGPAYGKLYITFICI